MVCCEMVLDPTKVGPLVFTRGEGQSSRGQPLRTPREGWIGLKEEWHKVRGLHTLPFAQPLLRGTLDSSLELAISASPVKSKPENGYTA